ncbi:MAG TPA: STAS domain-containing protein [Victivallales bacterium]|nr:STAS domain-containing protein [Victivallales bacterium]
MSGKNIYKDKTVLKFDKRMDSTKCMDAEDKIMTEIEGANEIVFDLNGVEYIASSFLRLCGKVSYKVGTENFSITNVEPSVKKVFKIAGLDKKLNILQYSLNQNCR